MGLVFKLVLAIFLIAGIPVIIANDDAFVSLVKRMDALEARNDALESRNDALKVRNDALEARNDALDARNKVLSDENEDLKARVEALEVIAANQQEEIKHLVVISEELTASHEHFADRFQEPTEQTSPDDDERHEVKERSQARATSRIRKASNEMSVAFYTYLDHHIESPGVHQTVVFDKVITNVGNAYNPHAGDFRAPVSGVYVFSTTMMAGTDSVPYHFQIMRNGSAVSNIYIPHGGTASNEAIFHLSQGDDVAIHNLDAGHRIYAWYSSFSGFLLQQDLPEVGLVGK